MLARELLDRCETPFHLILPPRVDVEAIQVMLQLPSGLADLDAGLLDQGGGGGELRIKGRQTLQRLQRAAHARMGAAVVLFEELQERSLRTGGEAAAVG